MINNISSMDTRPQVAVTKPMASISGMGMPAILGFKTPILKEKATIRVKKLKRSDNLVIIGDIDDDYVDTVEVEQEAPQAPDGNFFSSSQALFLPQRPKKKYKYLKNCYIIDYIQSPKPRCGLGTAAIKSLAEKAFFDPKAKGRIVTFSAPMVQESSPALFFYKLGFRFMDIEANAYMEECLAKKIPDIPAQVGMMYLPKNRIQKLLRYGDLF